VAVLLLAANALASLALANAAPVRSASEACTLAKASFAARDHFPMARIGFCDVIPATEGPRGFYVLTLHSTRRCEGICSRWLGSFAVERSSGRVFLWNVAEWELGVEVRRRQRPLPPIAYVVSSEIWLASRLTEAMRHRALSYTRLQGGVRLGR
jgi:hypothetical protein